MLMLNVPRHEVKYLGKSVYLPPAEWETVLALDKDPGVVMTREQIAQSVLGHNAKVDANSRAIDQYVARIRRKAPKCGARRA